MPISPTNDPEIRYSMYHPVSNPSGNPSANGYQVIHGNVSNTSLSDAQNTTDTTVNPDTTYYTHETLQARIPSGSSSRGSDSSGVRGGGSADTAEANGNREKLLEKAIDYIKHHYKPDSFEVTVKAIDIHLLDPSVDTIEIGDVVKVILADGTVKRGTCLKIQYDLMAPENTEYTIGDAEKAIA